MKTVNVEVTAPKFRNVSFRIEGSAPLVINHFSQKAQQQIHGAQEAGSTGKKNKGRTPKDFKKNYEQACYKNDGWYGIPAGAFRNAMVSACKLVGYTMTRAKLSVFIEADGFDEQDVTPLVRITKGEPQYFESYVRNETGVIDLRARPMWETGWEANVRVRYDADQFTLKDITNLMTRVGSQVGLCEGRPDSKRSCGMGWGLFNVKGDK